MAGRSTADGRAPTADAGRGHHGPHDRVHRAGRERAGSGDADGRDRCRGAAGRDGRGSARHPDRSRHPVPRRRRRAGQRAGAGPRGHVQHDLQLRPRRHDRGGDGHDELVPRAPAAGAGRSRGRRRLGDAVRHRAPPAARERHGPRRARRIERSRRRRRRSPNAPRRRPKAAIEAGPGSGERSDVFSGGPLTSSARRRSSG